MVRKSNQKKMVDMVIDEKLGLSYKILAWIVENEPVSNIQKLVTESGLSEDVIKLNIERLHKANLIDGHLIRGLGHSYITQVIDLTATFEGLKELKSRIQTIDANVSVFPITIEKLEFSLNLAKL